MANERASSPLQHKMTCERCQVLLLWKSVRMRRPASCVAKVLCPMSYVLEGVYLALDWNGDRDH